MFRKKFRQIHSLFTIFLILFQNLTPLFLFPKVAQAQAVTDLTTPITEQVEQQVIETEAATFEEITSNEIGEEVDESAEETEKTSEQETTEEAPTPQPSRQLIEAVTLKEPSEDEVETEISEASLWTQEGDIYTISQVELGKTYSAPQNDQVTITFTKLPENPGSLSVEEVILSDEQVEALRALSNVAYDITSDMENGSFEYDLTLPTPDNAPEDVKIIYAESVEELTEASTIASAVAGEDSIIAEGLDHFTIFVVVPADLVVSILPDSLLTYFSQGWRHTSTGNASIGLVGITAPSIPNNWGPHVVKMNRTGGSGINRSYLGYFDNELLQLKDIDEVTWNRYSKDGDDTYLNIFISENPLGLTGQTGTVVVKPTISHNIWQTNTFGPESPDIRLRIGGIDQGSISFADLRDNYGNWYIYNNTVEQEVCTTIIIWTVCGEIPHALVGGIVFVSGSTNPTNSQEHYYDGITLKIKGHEETFDFVETVPEQPVIEIIDPLANTFVGGTKAVKVNLTEAGYGLNWADAKFILESDWDVRTTPQNLSLVSGNLYQANINTKTVPDGIYRIAVDAQDNAGLSRSAANLNITIDNTRPIVNLTAPVGTTTLSSSVHDLIINATDNFALKRIVGNIYQSGSLLRSTQLAVPGNADNGTHLIDLATVMAGGNPLPQGTYTLRYNAEDMAGNISETKEFTFVIDNTAPTFWVKGTAWGNSYEPTSIGSGNTFKEVSFKLFDSQKIDKVTINGVVKDLSDNNWSDVNNVKPGVFGAVEGSNTLVVYDVAGNTSSYDFVLDITKPTVDLVFPAPGSSTKSFQAVFSEKVNPADATNPANYYLSNWPGYGGSGDLADDATIVYDETSKTATITFIHGDWYISPEQLWGVQDIHDLAGNLQAVNPYQEYSTPMVAPVTTDSGIDTNWHNSPVTVTLACTDVDGSGCKNTYYTIDGTEPTTSSAVGNNIILSTDGIYTIKYFSTDNAGNVESVKTAANQVKIDMTAPDAPNLVSPANGAVVNGSLLTNDWSDVADTHHYIYESYHDAAGENLRWHEEFTASQKSATNVANTTFWWRVKAIDAIGNQSPWSELWKVTVDNDAPVVFLTAPTNNILSGTVAIRGTVTDANPHHYWFVIQNSSNTQVAGLGTVNDSTSFTDKLLLNWDTNSVPDGTYTIKLEARDSANNKNENKDIPGSSAVWKTVTVDNTVPSSIITSYELGDGGTVATSTFSGLIEGTASDNLSGVSKVLLSISHLGFGQDESEIKYWDATGSAWVDALSIFDANGTTNWNYQLPEGEIPEGFYTITSHAVDNAGNVESTYQIKIVYDKTIPEVALTINPASPDGDNGWYRYTKPTITLTASDNHSLDHLEFQWNTTGGIWITYTGPIQPPGEGQNVLYYRAIDQVGNIFGPGVKEVKYDTTNPAGEPKDLRVENVTADTADAFWKAPENDSDVARYLVSWRHENGAQYGAETGRDDFDHKLTNLFDGLWTLTVKAVDHAGNFTQSQINFRVGPGPSSGGDGSVLGATTDDTSPLAATSAFGQTSGSIPADTDQANATSGDSTNPAANVNENNGDVLGTTSCSPWQNYLPIALLAIQLLILLAWEVMSKEAGVSKVLPSIVITAGIAAAYYWLRNAECFTQSSGLAMIDKWFIVMALVTGLAAKLVGKALFEEK